jgi:hypothetical protein
MGVWDAFFWREREGVREREWAGAGTGTGGHGRARAGTGGSGRERGRGVGGRCAIGGGRLVLVRRRGEARRLECTDRGGRACCGWG